MTHCRTDNDGGFTLLELMTVVVILGTLAAIVSPRCLVTTAEAKKASCSHNQAVIEAQVERWYFEQGSWPQNNLNDISAAIDYFPEGLPTCPWMPGKPYSLSASAHRVTGHNH